MSAKLISSPIFHVPRDNVQGEPPGGKDRFLRDQDRTNVQTGQDHLPGGIPVQGPLVTRKSPKLNGEYY